jgi:hypothetical protein
VAAARVGSVRDLNLYISTVAANPYPTGILVEVADNRTNTDTVPNSDMVYLDSFTAKYVKAGVDVVGLDHTVVRLDQTASGDGERWLGVVGGGNGSRDRAGTPGVVSYGGGGTPRSAALDVRNWGKAVVVGADLEMGAKGVTLDGRGWVTIAGSKVYMIPNDAGYPLAGELALLVQSTFRGSLAAVGLSGTTAVISEPNPAANVLAFAVDRACDLTVFPSCPTYTSAPNAEAAGATSTKQVSCGNYYNSTAETEQPANPWANANAKAAAASALQDLRTTYAAPLSRQCGRANVRVHRLFFQGYPADDPTRWARAGVRVQRY